MEKEEWIYKHIVLLFGYFKARIADNPYRQFHPTDKEDKMIRNFSKHLKKANVFRSVGEDYLIRYFIFQINRWYGIKSKRFGEYRIMLNWVIGPKALQHWFTRDQAFEYTLSYTKLVRERCKIDKNDIYALFKEQEEISKKILVNPIEEIDKKRFFNKPIGLAYCIETTTLCSNSKICLKCNVRQMCKELLKENYPKLYQMRGYGER